MMPPPSLQLASAEGARQSNLAFALTCLPRDRRGDALVFYDFCRAVDDIADDPARPTAEKTALLDQWKTALTEQTGLPEPLDSLIRRHDLDPSLLREIVLGVEMDIAPPIYESFHDLRAYCWRVACAVGLVSIKIFGCSHPDSKTFAEHLGYALQLTNILRDVAEDAALGRIYLPQEDLRRFGVNPERLLAGRPDGDFAGLMHFEAERARLEFHQAQNTLPAPDAHALRPAILMQAAYEKILTRMTTDGFRVFEKRYRLGKLDKALLLGRALLG